MGLLTSLVGNIIQAKRKQQDEDHQYFAQTAQVMAGILGSQDPKLKDLKPKAWQFYNEALQKHGGREGKQIAQTMNEWLQQQAEPIVFGMKQPQPQPPQQSFTPTNRTPVPPSQLVQQPQEQVQVQQAQQPHQRSGLMRVLSGLGTGVEEALSGQAPRSNLPQAPDPKLFQRPEQLATEEGQLAATKVGAQVKAELARFDADIAPQLKASGVKDEEIAQMREEIALKGFGVTPSRTGTKTFTPLQQAIINAKAELLKKPVNELTAPEIADALRTTKTFTPAQLLAFEAKASDLGKLVSELTAPEKEEALRDLKRTEADQDALAAKAKKLNKKVADLLPEEKIDARMDVKKKAMSEEMMAPDELERIARYDLLTGRQASFGLGANNPNRIGYLKARAKVIAELTPRSVAEQAAAFKADAASLGNLVRMADAVDAWEANAKLNLDQVLKLSVQSGRTGVPLANEYLQWAQGNLKDYPQLAKYRVAVDTAVADYTRVMYSPNLTGQTAQDERDRTQKLLNTAMAENSVEGAVDQMNIDMVNRHTTLRGQISDVQARMKEGAAGGAAPGGGTSDDVVEWEKGPDGKPRPKKK